jgi:exonuclease SbcD
VTIRLLHTSDWHLGRTIRNRPRTEEFGAVLDEVVRIAIDERVDGVLVAGDLYDSRAPAPEADAVLVETLVHLHEAAIPVVAIGGNHDSAQRLEAFAPLYRAVGATIVGNVQRPDAGGVVELASRDRGTTALIACVPFVPERRFASTAALFDASESWYATYADGMGNLLDAFAAAFRPDRVNVLMAHLYADGSLLGGGEREVTVGLEYAVSPARLPATASYLALGHIHRPQRVAGTAAPGRYSGSLLQLDFGETEQQKSVAIVEAAPGTPATIREVALTAGRRLVDLRGSLDAVTAAAETVGDAWLRVLVETDGPIPGIADRVREALPNALDVKLVYDRTADDETGPRSAGVGALNPRDQFAAYERLTHGVEPDPALLAAFDEVLTLVRDGED